MKRLLREHALSLAFGLLVRKSHLERGVPGTVRRRGEGGRVESLSSLLLQKMSPRRNFFVSRGGLHREGNAADAVPSSISSFRPRGKGERGECGRRNWHKSF